MNNIDNINSLMCIFLDDFFCMIFSCRCTRFRCKEDSYIFFIKIFSTLNCNNIFFYDIVWFGIDGYNNNMFEMFCSFFYCVIFIPIFLFKTQKIQIGTEYIKIGFKYFY